MAATGSSAARRALRFFSVLPRADAPLAFAWFALLLLRGLLPAALALTMGALVAAVQAGTALAAPLVAMGTVFVLLQVLAPLHQSLGKNLGDSTARWLYDTLAQACLAPDGIAHLEDERLATDLAMARDFDLGISGPPLAISMDFVAGGLVEFVGGVVAACVLFAYAWWAPLLLGGAWLATHWLLRESAVWQDRNTSEVREAQRHADYAYRLAVDAPAAKELRLFGLGGWSVERFRQRRRRLFDLQWAATRLRERSVGVSLVLVLGANLFVFYALTGDAASGVLPLGALVTFATAAISTSMIAFGGLSWALDGAAAPADTALRLGPDMAARGALDIAPSPATEPRPARTTADAANGPSAARTISLRDVHFSYPGGGAPVLRGVDLEIPAGSSLAIVGQNGAGKTTLAKLLCRLYDPQQGAIEVDGQDLRTLPADAWRACVAAVFQDYLKLELPLRDNVAPSGADDAAILEALGDAGARELAALDTVLSRAYPGGTDLSGGQWQRIALARALCAVRQGAGLVLLDEPTAQLDVRGEAEIFRRLLAATRHVTTVLVSHRFSTVRRADRICVLEHGRVIELGSHDELMALGGRYREMFDLQAARFESDGADGASEGGALDALDD